MNVAILYNVATYWGHIVPRSLLQGRQFCLLIWRQRYYFLTTHTPLLSSQIIKYMHHLPWQQSTWGQYDPNTADYWVILCQYWGHILSCLLCGSRWSITKALTVMYVDTPNGFYITVHLLSIKDDFFNYKQRLLNFNFV